MVGFALFRGSAGRGFCAVALSVASVGAPQAGVAEAEPDLHDCTVINARYREISSTARESEDLVNQWVVAKHPNYGQAPLTPELAAITRQWIDVQRRRVELLGGIVREMEQPDGKALYSAWLEKVQKSADLWSGYLARNVDPLGYEWEWDDAVFGVAQNQQAAVDWTKGCNNVPGNKLPDEPTSN